MQLSDITIVAADDDDLNLEILCKNLEDAGLTVSSHKDGDQALKYLQENSKKIQLILLDKMMPKMNGLDVLKAIKSNPGLKHIAVIIQTSDADITEKQIAIELGAANVLIKPFSPDTMIEAVKTALAGKPRELDHATA